jgi:hypothetical protein
VFSLMYEIQFNAIFINLLFRGFSEFFLRSEILTAVTMYVVIFEVVMPCTPLDGYQGFGETYHIPFQGDISRQQDHIASQTRRSRFIS